MVSTTCRCDTGARSVVSGHHVQMVRYQPKERRRLGAPSIPSTRVRTIIVPLRDGLFRRSAHAMPA